jgi:F-type H+-transporting ATPase subunit delta
MSEVSKTAQGVAQARATVLEDVKPELTRVYAEALLNAAEKAGDVDGLLDELEAIRTELLGKFPAFALMMGSPLRTVSEKDRIIGKILEGRASPIVVRFLRVLNRHDRIALLASVLRAARAGWQQRQNLRPVTIRSAVALDSAQTAALHDRLAGALKATPVLHLEVDPGLIGGLIVQVGDDVYDASIRNRLEQLHHRLIEGKSHEIQSRRDHFSHPE